MALTVTTSTVTVDDDQKMLSLVRQCIQDVFTLGQSYSIIGSRTWTAADLPELRKMETRYERRILLAAGATGRNLLDFTTGRGSNDPPQD